MNVRDCLIGCFTFMASAQLFAQGSDPWWFDVEVIVFKRTLDTPSSERFEEAVELATGYSYDLTTAELYPNITGVLRALPSCPVAPLMPSLESIVESYTQWVANQIQDDDLSAPSILPSSPQPSAPPELVLADIASEESVTREDFFRDENELENSIEEDPNTVLINRVQVFIDNAEPLIPLVTARPFDCLTQSDINVVDESFFLVDNQLPKISAIPKRIDGKNWFLPQFPHILPIGEQQLTDFANKIERIRDHQILHHTAWRQEVIFGRDVAPSMRLVAGEDFMASFLESKAATEANANVSLDSLSEVEQSDEEQTEIDFFSQLQSDLATSHTIDVDALLASIDESNEIETESVTPEWELDGEFKVFLQYINGVPYLHVDSELVFQRLSAQQKETQWPNLQRIPFKQLRRVISKQIHYFDHPLFGLVVQIRRHQRPSPIERSAEQTVD